MMASRVLHSEDTRRPEVQSASDAVMMKVRFRRVDSRKHTHTRKRIREHGRTSRPTETVPDHICSFVAHVSCECQIIISIISTLNVR